MKTITRGILALMVALLLGAPPVHADRHGHFRHGGHVGFGVYIGPDWWGPNWWGPGWGPYPYYPYYSPPPVVVQPPPEIYVQPEPRQEQPPQYWYYCPEPEGYYPYVKKCPRGWLKVVPPENPPDGEE
ncbi:hypothetical protein GURASL_35710 [Geotalea uraniireducens]|uniref:Proline-rich region n=1 Tax=Geotalea uraniireducens TaxID=351604 RepID=A0ABN6VW96_9BACT|nr:hypothetical protein [Geotalea uraniireducens]BDV44648.1 hypothetical protein GURASL_35710 [Geotalea uraniireducens]